MSEADCSLIVCETCKTAIEPRTKVFLGGDGKLRHYACAAGVTWRCQFHDFTTADKAAWLAHRATCTSSEEYVAGVADPVTRCAVCRRRFTRAGEEVPFGDDRLAHRRCADAHAIASSSVNRFVWALVDTRELTPAARASRIEALCEDLIGTFTTAVIGAGNRGPLE